MDVDSYLSDFTERDWQTTENVEPTRLAVIGMGWWTENFALPAIAASDYCETRVLVSGSPDVAERLGENHCPGDIEIVGYDAYHDGAAGDEYDAAYVVTPNDSHLDFAETAASLGKDVLCEKPMEKSVERAERLVDACETTDVTLMTAYRMQADPAMRRLRELLADGVVGDPVQLHGGFSYHLVGSLPGQWRRDAAVSGGGSLTDIGVYPLNTARFLLDADPTRVTAETSGTRRPRRTDRHADHGRRLRVRRDGNPPLAVRRARSL